MTDGYCEARATGGKCGSPGRAPLSEGLHQRWVALASCVLRQRGSGSEGGARRRSWRPDLVDVALDRRDGGPLEELGGRPVRKALPEVDSCGSGAARTSSATDAWQCPAPAGARPPLASFASGVNSCHTVGASKPARRSAGANLVAFPEEQRPGAEPRARAQPLRAAHPHLRWTWCESLDLGG